MPRLPVVGLAAAAAVAGAAQAGPAFDVLSYEVTLTPDFGQRTLTGRETVRLMSLKDGLQTLEFSGNALAVAAEGAKVRQAGGRLQVELPAPLKRGQAVTLRLAFSGTPARGLTWGARSAYSGYFTCDWMVCDQDRMGDLARFRLHLNLPDGMTGETTSSARPHPPFMFGFAAGEFARIRPAGGLVVLSDAATADELSARFAPTRAMQAFFEAKAGLPLGRYVQVLTKESSAQEAAGLSFVGRPELDPILETPQEDWVIAHEMAHQWWGVRVACADLSQFWLNEGLATFMTAAWKEQRWGRAAYERELEIARTRWKRASDQGLDRPIAYAGTYRSLGARRAIVYSKATLFLDELRRQMGDEAFWTGLRAYTRANDGRTATSQDFQAAMQAATTLDLGPLFETWVYRGQTPPPA